MKKPHVLNRPMFNTGGTSAYGKGITSNLVTEEQRQRFNYGGRVKLAQGSPWEGWGWSRDPSLQLQYPPYGGDQRTGTDYTRFWDTQRALANMTQMKKYAAPTLEVTEDLESQNLEQGSDPRYFKRKFKNQNQ